LDHLAETLFDGHGNHSAGGDSRGFAGLCVVKRATEVTTGDPLW
jgi:hypothetical protein